jgi:hypothetical protein
MIAADGENIPYGKPYSLAQAVQTQSGVQRFASQKKERASFDSGSPSKTRQCLKFLKKGYFAALAFSPLNASVKRDL